MKWELREDDSRLRCVSQVALFYILEDCPLAEAMRLEGSFMCV